MGDSGKFDVFKRRPMKANRQSLNLFSNPESEFLYKFLQEQWNREATVVRNV